MKLRARVLTRLPATLQADGGLKVSKVNGVWTFEPAWEQLVREDTIADPEARELWVRNTTTGVYNRLSVQYLIDSLPPGPDGDDGSLIYSQPSAPATAGVPPGSIWIDSDSADIDVFQISGSTWVDTGINLKGATGPTGASYAATSTSSQTIASTGTKTFTTQAGLAYQAGARVRATSGANWMEGVVSSYSGTTLVFTADKSSGSGTFTSWTINLAGQPGVDGAGTGDVVGPSSSVSGRVATFSGTTGKLIQDGGTLLSALALSARNVVSGAGLTGGGDLSADRTLAVGAGTGITVGADDVSISPAYQAIGKQPVYIPAAAMVARTANGAALGTVEMTTNKQVIKTLDFDTTTQEFAQFSIRMPKSWNEGTVSFVPVWSHAATTTNFGVVWALEAVAISNDDTLDAAWGTAGTSTDTGGTTNDLYEGPESSAITIAGTPAEGDTVYFQVKRNVADAADTMAIDARLHGVLLYIVTNAANDQ